MYAAVGFGSITATKVLSKVLEEYRKTKPNTEIEEKIEELHTRHHFNDNVSKTGIIVKGIDNCLIKLSKCCNPVPGDEIIGYITRGRGVTVHTKDCVNTVSYTHLQRLLKALYKKIDEKPDDAYLQRQISLLNRANISTIHSFCLNMIKNNFYLLEMPANFRIGDTAEIEILKQEVIESIFEEKYENNDKEFLDLIRKYTTYSDDQNLKDLIIKIYEYSRCTPNPRCV